MKKKIVKLKDLANLGAIKRKVSDAFSERGKEAADAIRALIDELEQSEVEVDEEALTEKIKEVLETKSIPDWQARKAELEAMEVPDAAGSLHRLRLKICDARIDAAASYARWMDDKKAATIRSSDNSLRMAKTLEKDAELLTKQVNAHVR